MKNTRSLVLSALLLVSALPLFAQNWTPVTATKLGDVSGQLVSSGKLCFTPTDTNDAPIGVQIGGGGQAATVEVCAVVTNGVSTVGFQIPNPAHTVPAGVLYRIRLHDARGDIRIWRRVPVGTTFNLDNYSEPASVVPLTGTTITGPFTVLGDFSVTGLCTGCGTGGGGGGSGIWGGITGTLTKSDDLVAALALKAPLDSAALTGTPTAPTPATADNTTKLATTAFVKAQGYLAGTTVLPQTKALVSTQWLDSYNATTGLFTASQPAFTSLTGLLGCTQMPTFTGDVANSNCGMTIQANAITFAKIATATYLGTGTKLLSTSATAPGSPKCAEFAADGTIGIAGTNAACGSGGTGMANPMTTSGDIIYGGAAGAPTRLAGNTTTTPLVYQSTGSAGVATAPTLGTIDYSLATIINKPTIPSTPAGVGLGSVTNDVQTKAAIMPNTVPAAGQIPVGNAGGTAFAPVPVSGDATLSSTGALTLATTGISAATYTNPTVTTDVKGRITSIANGSGGGLFTAANNATMVAGTKTTTGTCTFKTNTSNQLEADCPIKTPAGASNFTSFTNASPATGDFWMDTDLFKYRTSGAVTKTFAFLDSNITGTAAGLSANIAESQVTSLVGDLALKAPLASPALTGTPTVPTATPATNNTQAASTAYVDAAVAASGGGANAAGSYIVAASTSAPTNYQVITAGANVTVTPNAGTHTLTIAASGGGGAPTFPVTSQTANYTVLAGDFSACKLITVSNAGATTVTLLGTAPAAGQCISVGNIGAGGVTVARNGLTIDGAASNVSLTTNQSVDVISDGTNYFTRRGIGGAGGSGMTVNAGSSATNLSDSTPAAPIATKPGALNVNFQISGANASGYVNGVMQRYMDRRVGIWTDTGSAYNFVGSENQQEVAQTPSHVVPQSGVPYPYIQITTGTTINTPAGIRGSPAYQRGGSSHPTNLYWSTRIALMDNAAGSQRVCLGLTSTTISTTCSGDTPTLHGAYFRFSTAIGSNWYCVTSAGGTPNAVDSTIDATVDANWHKFEIAFDDSGSGTAHFFIDGTERCSAPTTSLPGTTTNLSGAIAIYNLAAAAKRIQTTGTYTESNY
jgi:hypothetical protein